MLTGFQTVGDDITEGRLDTVMQLTADAEAVAVWAMSSHHSTQISHTNAVNDALLSQLERSQLVTVLCAALNKIMDELCLTEQEMTPLDREVRACCDCPQQLGTVCNSTVTC